MEIGLSLGMRWADIMREISPVHVKKIKEMLDDGVRIKDITRALGIKYYTVKNIKQHKAYRSIK